MKDKTSGPVRLLRPEKLSDQVRTYLLRELTSGRLAPGDRINEAELARQLGISRNPIREAISALAQSGFLVMRPWRGAFLRSFSVKDVDDVFSFRICIESFAARQAMSVMTKRDHRVLVDLVDQMETVAATGDYVEVQELDLAFHRRLCDVSRNEQAIRAYAALHTEMQMLIASVDIASGPLQDSARAHRPIAEAISRGDTEGVVRALEEHIRFPWSLARDHYRAIEEAVPAEAGRKPRRVPA